MTLKKEFLGRGWNFPFLFNAADGRIAFSEYEENIRQNITIILATRPGERQMLPKFGCRIQELLFAPNNDATRALAARHVKDALSMWEPRITVNKVKAAPDPSGAIRLDVEYVINSTGAVERLQQVVSNSAP